MIPALGLLPAGGASRRMGRDKAGMELAGVSLLDRAAALLARVTPRVVRLGGGDGAGLPGAVDGLWADRSPGAGPAAALAAAMQRHPGPVVVCAVDLPLVPAGLLRHALRCVRHGAAAAVPRHGGRWHPLCAAYAPGAGSPLRRRLAAGHRDLQGWLDDLPVVALDAAVLAAWGPADRILWNVNRPEDLEKAATLLGG